MTLMEAGTTVARVGDIDPERITEAVEMFNQEMAGMPTGHPGAEITADVVFYRHPECKIFFTEGSDEVGHIIHEVDDVEGIEAFLKQLRTDDNAEAFAVIDAVKDAYNSALVARMQRAFARRTTPTIAEYAATLAYEGRQEYKVESVFA